MWPFRKKEAPYTGPRFKIVTEISYGREIWSVYEYLPNIKFWTYRGLGHSRGEALKVISHLDQRVEYVA